jgi:uncharacterized protein
MKVRPLGDPASFLVAAGPLLLESEARHNLLLGIAGTLRDHPSVYREHRLWVVEDGDLVVGAALQTPPFNIVVAEPRADGALLALADALADEGTELPGVTAAVPEVDSFADAWESRSGCPRRRRMAQGVYRLTKVYPPHEVSGRARVATANDRDLLVSWVRAFADEALEGVEAPVRSAEHTVDERIAEGSGGFMLWEDDEPVSLAGWGGRTPNGVRIGPVYTPPPRRGRGYGRAITAAVSAEQLAGGRQFCFLYTDLANPTSNRIYVDIGYERVCDSVDYAFERP